MNICIQSYTKKFKKFKIFNSILVSVWLVFLTSLILILALVVGDKALVLLSSMEGKSRESQK